MVFTARRRCSLEAKIPQMDFAAILAIYVFCWKYLDGFHCLEGVRLRSISVFES